MGILHTLSEIAKNNDKFKNYDCQICYIFQDLLQHADQLLHHVSPSGMSFLSFPAVFSYRNIFLTAVFPLRSAILPKSPSVFHCGKNHPLAGML